MPSVGLRTWYDSATNSESEFSLKEGMNLWQNRIRPRMDEKKWNKSSGKKILNTTFYPDQKGINKFIKGKSELKGNKQVY